MLIQSIAIIGIGLCLKNLAHSEASSMAGSGCEMEEEYDSHAWHRRRAVYDWVRQVIGNGYDIRRKELINFVQAVELLNNRWGNIPSNCSNKELLNIIKDKDFTETESLFNSETGRASIALYTSSVDGKRKNLACTSTRQHQIIEAASRNARDPTSARVFGKIHQEFVKKSARKCLESTCKNIDTRMGYFDSLLPRGKRAKPFSKYAFDKAPNVTYALENVTASSEDREFKSQELSLCHFFKQAADHETPCELGGEELRGVDLFVGRVPTDQLKTLLRSYKAARSRQPNSSFEDFEIDQLRGDQDLRVITSACEVMRPQLSYYLQPIKWYISKDLIAGSNWETREGPCQSLDYWMQVDRLCDQISASLA